MSSIDSSLLDFSGFAAVTDFEKNDWKILFDKLEYKQQEFIRYENQIRSDLYKWPRDPLHTWSRLWEYPYVYYHIQQAQKQRSDKKLHVLDFGSGVTFFPFAIAELGCHVNCADIDPICAIDIPKAVMTIHHAPGSVKASLIEAGKIPIDSESQDIVYCISVIEHIPDFESVVDEMARVLKHGGFLILTVDIDLRGDFELSVEQYERLLIKLEQHFTKGFPERPVHPRNLLTTANSPYPMKNRSLLSSAKQLIKNSLTGHLLNGDPRVGVLLGIYSAIYKKK